MPDESGIGISTPETVVLIASDTVGRGDDELGATLMRAFLGVLPDVLEGPAALIFVNHGVKLTTTGSPVLEELEALTEQGAELYSCATCLNWLGLQHELAAGEPTNMLATVTRLQAARRVIRP